MQDMGGGRRDRGCERFGVVGADTVDRRRVDPEPRRNLREIDGRKVAADVFALLSEREPWGVVVNEAAACGLPLVLSDRVGAAFDLLRDGENGVLVMAGDVESAASALRRLAQNPAARAAAGARSQELMEGWGYKPSIEGFLGAVRAAVSR